ncbi:uncharacterized protein LOC132314571 [Cornus florida]|uniref:uncharacterized protein LOC132314571 n=1 Tax=Cornus florida TaxID=4283 RepID=UPI00289F95C9|nr:uncharacterized protein LOC132314571 [Cornus florida]
MGNCHAFYTFSKHPCARTTAAKHRKVLRVVKTDGKVLEFSKPLRVENLLVEFSGSGVSVSKEAFQCLPPNYELKLGRIYYLLPLPGSVTAINPAGVSSIDCTEQKRAVKRIKMVVTKRQLQDLLSKKVSVEDVLSGMERKRRRPIDSSVSWKPKLESIPEGSQ